MGQPACLLNVDQPVLSMYRTTCLAKPSLKPVGQSALSLKPMSQPALSLDPVGHLTLFLEPGGQPALSLKLVCHPAFCIFHRVHTTLVAWRIPRCFQACAGAHSTRADMTTTGESAMNRAHVKVT